VLFLTHFDGFLEVSRFKVHISLIIGKIFGIASFILNFLKQLVRFLVIIAFISYKTQIILGLRSIFLGSGNAVEIIFCGIEILRLKINIAVIKLKTFLFGPA